MNNALIGRCLLGGEAAAALESPIIARQTALRSGAVRLGAAPTQAPLQPGPPFRRRPPRPRPRPAEIRRLLTHSSNPSAWLEECRIFYEHLRNRGYPAGAIDFCFRSFNSLQRNNMLIWQVVDSDLLLCTGFDLEHAVLFLCHMFTHRPMNERKIEKRKWRRSATTSRQFHWNFHFTWK